jgi:Raf kinase inhibitor-like YbhB/YbcL family protein
MNHRGVCCLLIVVFAMCSLIDSCCLAQSPAGAGEKIRVKSPSFKEGGLIPKQYTCDGQNISPPLTWTGVPSAAKSLVLICDDPDAPKGTWVHWVVFNIPPDVLFLAPGAGKETDTIEDYMPRGGRGRGKPVLVFTTFGVHGTTDFKRVGYGGPCPPSGTHRYYFKLYALDTMLNLQNEATKASVEKAMEGHILAEGQLMGKYKRSR